MKFKVWDDEMLTLEQKERLVDSLESAIEFHCESATFCDDRCCQILDDLKTILELLKNKLTE